MKLLFDQNLSPRLPWVLADIYPEFTNHVHDHDTLRDREHGSFPNTLTGLLRPTPTSLIPPRATNTLFPNLHVHDHVHGL